MKKTTLIILLALVLALGAVGLAGCNLDGITGKVSPGEFETDEQVFGFSAASAATVISAMNGGSASEAALALAPTSEVTDEAVLAELNDYMFLVESIFADGAFGFKIVDSDLEGYAHKMTVSYKDITGAAVDYEMYYNEEVVSSETEWDDGEEETETVNRIEGVLRVDGVDYPMSGFSEVSTEGDENEREHELRVDMGDGKSLVVEQEIENERNEQEQEYVYSVYDGRRLVEQSVFSFEQERDETEIELEQRVRGEDGSMTTTLFSFEKEIEHGKEVIRIDIRGNGGNVRGSYVSTDTKTAIDRDTTQYRAASEHLSGPRFFASDQEDSPPHYSLRVRDSAPSEGAPKPKGTTCCRASIFFLSHPQRASPAAKATSSPNSTLTRERFGA